MSTLSGPTTGHYGTSLRHQTLAGATLIFYPNQSTPDASVWGWKPLDDIPKGEIGRAVVDEDGSYAVDLDYEGGSVLVALEAEKLAYAPASGRTARGLLGTGVPTRNTLAIDIPHSAYCALLKALDLWLVAGRVSDCAKTPTPAPGATVTVFDRDLTQDDTLGSDTTDGTGSFEVFFPRSTFHQIPALPPPFDAILPHELIGGPDVYVRVEKGGATLLDEDPSIGRTPARENRPNCTYVELCVEPPEFDVDTVTLWTHIGNIEVPTYSSLKDFDADGFVDSGKLAFTGRIDLNGQVSQTLFGQPVRFRFLVAEWASLSTAPAYPADYTPLTAAHITGAAYGAIYTQTGPGPFDYDTAPVAPAPDANGWIQVTQDPDFVRNVDRMVQVDTSTLVPAISKAGPQTAGAGDPVPAANQDRARKFSFRLEVNAGSTTYLNPVPVVIHLNNSAAYARFNLQELLADACDPVASSGGSIVVHPHYSIGHPYLHGYSLTVQRQGGSLLTAHSEDFTTNSPVWTPPAGESGTVTATYTDLPSPPKPCSYRAWLSFSRRLTTGYGGPGDSPLLRTFCGS